MKKILFPAFVLMVMAACGGGGTDGENGDDVLSGIYISGTSSFEDTTMETILVKDGELAKLDVPSSLASSVYVTDTSVYMAGAYSDTPGGDMKPCYWKDGTRVELDMSDAFEAIGLSIFVVGDDVYVTGYRDISGTGDKACYWKNGVLTDLEKGQAYSVYVYNGDVYISGYDQNMKPAYWKNGVKTALSTKTGVAYGIVVNAKGIHTAGMEVDGDVFAVYWKNGTATKLSNVGSDAAATSIAIYGSDVYVVGVAEDYQKLVYWKNTAASITELDTDSYQPAFPLDCAHGWCAPKIAVNDTGFHAVSVLSDGTDIVKSSYWNNDTTGTIVDDAYTNVFVK